jgi:ATP-dependent Clp protease adaptor protein ClpS
MSTPKKPGGNDRRDDDLGRERREGVGTLTRKQTKRPPLYKVLLHNDDYTTRDFVVLVLVRYFHKNQTEATHIMLHVHHNGMGVAGIFPYDIASTKKHQVEQLARQYEMPLKLSLEPEDG